MRCDAIVVGGGMVGVSAADHLARRFGGLKLLSPEELAERFPSLYRDDVLVASHAPADGFIRPAEYVTVLGGLLQDRGVEIFEQAPVEALVVEGSRVVGVTVGGALIPCPRVLLAAGVWSRPLLQTVGLDAPVRPYRTQAAFLFTPPGEDLPVIHDGGQHIYTVPRGPGSTLVGDGTEQTESDPDRFRRDPDPGFLDSARTRFARRVPGAAAAPVTGGWAGLCTATPDRYPLLGPYGVDGLHVAFGFNGLASCVVRPWGNGWRAG